MKKIIICILCVSLSLVAKAQEKVDSISQKQSSREMNVSISIEDLSRLENEKRHAIQSIDSLQKLNRVNKEKLTKIESENVLLKSKYVSLKSQCDSLQIQYDVLVSGQVNANKKLVNIASNFLYIPYEAYSIQEIAIPAFRAITDPQLIKKHQVKLVLLENYKQDIEDVLAFISDIEKELGIPFTKDLKSLEQRFLKMNFYIRYSQYDDWRNTYLGKKLVYIDNKMKSYDGHNKPDFSSIKNELNQCLKSIENL